MMRSFLRNQRVNVLTLELWTQNRCSEDILSPKAEGKKLNKLEIPDTPFVNLRSKGTTFINDGANGSSFWIPFPSQQPWDKWVQSL